MSGEQGLHALASCTTHHAGTADHNHITTHHRKRYKKNRSITHAKKLRPSLFFTKKIWYIGNTYITYHILHVHQLYIVKIYGMHLVGIKCLSTIKTLMPILHTAYIYF